MAPAPLLAPFTYVQIVAAVVFGVAVFGDVPDFWTLVGTVLVILAGVYVLASVVLALSTRQVHRLLQAYRSGGAGSLAHKARGRPSNNRIQEDVRNQAMALVRAHYPDFGPTLAAEMLALRHELKISRETLRGWLAEAGLWLSRRQ